MKNTHTHKRLVPKIMVSFFIVFTVLFCLMQLSLVYGQEGMSSITGNVSDEGVDTDNDGYFDYLNLEIEVNITRAAEYKLDAGGLYDISSSDFVSILNEKTMYLDEGIHVIDIPLNGTEIYASEVNPTNVAGIYLYNETGDTIDSLVDYGLSSAYSFSEFQRPTPIMEFTTIERGIILDQAGSIQVINTYFLTNLGFEASEINVGFPEGASNFEVRDEMGTLGTSTENSVMTVTFREKVPTNETETLYIIYRMPWEELVSQQNGVDYTFQFTLFEEFDTPIGELSVSITLPQGADFQSANPESDSTTKSDMRETLNYVFSDLTPSQDLIFSINYRYFVFWASFYPTMWIGIVAIVAFVVLFFMGTPKTITAPTIQVQPKALKRFVDTYEEKATIRSELEALEERLRKGRIPRRRYKVRKKMLDGRLSTVSRNLSSISETIRSAGSKYANMMRQIEVAETKLEGAERDKQRIKTRYRRGEVSKGAYGKLLEEYQNRIEDAEATIDGVLLRLRD
ncbi:hypothetical protein ACFLRN_10295 [Thermoproteota archaeon]